MKRNLAMMVLVWLVSIAAAAAHFADPTVKMGPLLHFNGIEPHNHVFNVGALYLLKDQDVFPEVKIFDDGIERRVAGKVIGKKFGYSFVRYLMNIQQSKKPRFVQYQIANERRYKFFVPPAGQEARVLYHSCNGYQYTADKEKLGGITSMWEHILESHRKNPYAFQFGGGDQIYADGLILGDSCPFEPADGDVHGVFAIKRLLSWLADKENLATAEFTAEMKRDVEEFYFHQYVNHYNEAGFKEAMAEIPGDFEADDHDYFDGCGSYPDWLQNCNVMAGIREIARWFVFTVQHQLAEDEIPRDELSKPRAYHYLQTVGSLAVMAIDTRTERTPTQILSPKSYEEIFAKLAGIGPEVKHVAIMLGVPLVYTSTGKLEKAMTFADSLPITGSLLGLMPGYKNAFGLPELADDGKDGWGAHIAERNRLVKMLQDFAERMNVRVTLVGGDVHLGGAGKIYSNSCGFEDCSSTAIYQIISSPVGNMPVGKSAAKCIGLAGCKPQSLEDDCSMCLFKLEREDGIRASTLIGQRNFVSLSVGSDMELKVKWSAEAVNRDEAPTVYNLNIPQLFR